MSRMIEVSDFPAYLAEPAPTAECKGGLIVVHEVWGLDDHIKSVADRFAAEGYLALAPDLLSETGIYDKLTPGLAEDLFNPERRNQVQPQLRAIMTPLRQPGFAEETVVKLQPCFNYLAEQPSTSGQVYPDCGHAFFNDTNRFTYNQAAAQDAWQKVLAFLAANV